MNTVAAYTRVSLMSLLASLMVMPVSAMADSGVYIGGSVGNAGVKVNDIDFDENDSAYKAFLGYRLDLPAVFVAVEGGYVNLGKPELSVGGASASVEPTGLNLFGIAGLETGPIDLFVKAGYISWDADLVLDDGLGNVETDSDNGSDLGYGLGIAFGLGPVEVRGEYEIYDISDADVSMISVGFSYLFD